MWVNTRRENIHKATVLVFFCFLFAQSLISWNTIQRGQFGPVHIYVSEQDGETEFSALDTVSVHRGFYANNRSGRVKPNVSSSADIDWKAPQRAPDESVTPGDKGTSDLKIYKILSTRVRDVKRNTSNTIEQASYMSINKDHIGRKMHGNQDDNTNFATTSHVLKTLTRSIVFKPSLPSRRTADKETLITEVDSDDNKNILHPELAETFSSNRNSSKDVSSLLLDSLEKSEKIFATNLSLWVPRFSAKTVNQQIAKESLSREKIVELDTRLRDTLKAIQMHCPVTPPNLTGRISFKRRPAKENLPEVELGGRWRPSHCKANHHVAIIIPYRDRLDHLRTLLSNLHPLLQKQQLDYGIYVVEMAHPTPFNRGLLMNVGFVEARLLGDYQCYIYHDVDLIPEDDRNLYTCPDKNRPRHMSVAVSSMQYRLPYRTIFGGVSAMTEEQFLAVNGFSNLFFGWGGEDDDLSKRLRQKGYRISRYSPEVARYTMLKHEQQSPNPNRWKLLKKAYNGVSEEGLSTLQYRLLKLELRDLYTWIYVDVEKEEAR